MENVRKLLNEANSLFRTSDHIMYVTYPLVKDNKLIICVTENLSSSLIKAMEAVLHYDRLYKRIEIFPENFYSKLDIFKRKCAVRYNIDRKYIILIEDLKRIVDERRKSKMEFVRKDKYVICDSNYSTKIISINKLKEYLNISRNFIKQVNQIIGNV